MNSINRRSVLLAGLGMAGTGALTAFSGPSGSPTPRPANRAVALEQKRFGTGRTRDFTLTAAPVTLDLGGVTVDTWAYDGRIPGREMRVTAGDTVTAELSSRLPQETVTTIHWHGIALPNPMDGVALVTENGVRPDRNFTYRYVADVPGTYFFHSHVGVQLDRGLYGPLIVEDPREPLSYDDEWVIVLDDWIDGVSTTPDEVLAELTHGMDGTNTASGHVKYPYHLVNGKVPADPDVYTGTPGRRVRLRIINAGSDTAYRVALGGHRMTITHTDGYPVEHQETDALLIAMGERYDALVTLADGVFPLVAVAEGKGAAGLALVRTASGRAPSPDFRPKELDGVVLAASELRAAADVRLPDRETDSVHRIVLTGSMRRYDWAINGVRFDMNHPAANRIPVDTGQRVRLDFVNRTAMWHPMHLHGHTYQLDANGPRKDTTVVLPRKTVSVWFDADNPGQWMLHCHNLYHGEAGLMTMMAYGK